MGLVLSPRAQRDIEDIWDYSAFVWGLDQADDYVRQIQRALQILAAEPRIGRACDEIRRGYRKYRISSSIARVKMASR